jgi:hypothetical protein
MTDADDDELRRQQPVRTPPTPCPAPTATTPTPNTFPGAAPLDSADACMTDADGDDYGDDTPDSPDAEPGTDCDDSEPGTFPNSAESEEDPGRSA